MQGDDFESIQDPDFSVEPLEAQVNAVEERQLETVPLVTHEDWLRKVQDMEASKEVLLRALEAEGSDPNTDPDYQFFLGNLSLARSQLRGFAVMRAINIIDKLTE